MAEAYARNLELPLSPQVVRAATAPDRRLLRSALEVMVRAGVGADGDRHVAGGMGQRVHLGRAARAVLYGVRDFDPEGVSAEDLALGRTRAPAGGGAAGQAG